LAATSKVRVMMGTRMRQNQNTGLLSSNNTCAPRGFLRRFDSWTQCGSVGRPTD
jgi:hypothetical protein